MINPLGDQIILRPVPLPETTKVGTIIVPTTSNETAIYATVVASGPETSIVLNEGRKVLTRKWQLVAINVDGEELFVARMPDIIAFF